MQTIIDPHNELMAPRKNTPRDVFLHLFTMAALYWSAVSFITLCWQYVNYFFPDVLNTYDNQSYVWAIRFSVASLMIVFPLFLLASWYLARIYRQESGARDSRIRKWLIYITLFFASLIIIGDLISVIYNFLGGDVTIRFVLKALSVLVVAGVIFWYYLDDVRRPSPSSANKFVAWASGAVVVAMIIGAFFIVGSPITARRSQFDDRRISDLQTIQYQVVNYWQRKGQLPDTLADLNDSISGYQAPTDPETSQPYEYAIQSPFAPSFQLCATFNLSSSVSAKSLSSYPYGDAAQNWNHSAGRFCFDRTIDQQLYPPLDRGK